MANWTKDESLAICLYMGRKYDMSGGPLEGYNVDFEGDILFKTSNGYKVYDWECKEVLCEGTLFECMDYILK